MFKTSSFKSNQQRQQTYQEKAENNKMSAQSKTGTADNNEDIYGL
jgi:hypothetical protein